MQYNTKKTKRAQLKIQQMAFMLIAVTLFFVFVGLFLLSIRFANLKEDATLLEEKNAMLLVAKLANSPEFSCEDAFGSKLDCVDADKVMVLKENIAKYTNFWGVSSIEIRKIYPKTEGEVLCDTENYPECNIIEVTPRKGTGVSTFVSLCRKEALEGEIYDKCELAKIIVGYESK